MITELYQRTLKELTSSNRAWMDFLKTAAFQYKYPFSDQVLIHAQRPGAVACAELEVWNEKFGRWVNKGAHGIALIRDKGGRAALAYVFDVRDTHHRDELPFRLWEARSEMRRDIAEALENSFGHLPMKATIGDAAISACENICEDNLTDYLDNLMSSADGSLLDDYDEDNMRVRLLPLLKYSTAYAVLTRLGYKADESLDMDDLAALREFNTPEVINVLGTATGDLSEICLREIERTVRAYEKNKIRTFAETENVRYNNPEKNNTLGKGGQENEHGSNVPLQSTWGSDDSRSETARTDQLSSRQIRNDAARISKEASEGNVHDASHASEAERASARSGESGERTDLDDYIPDGTEPWGDGADESDRPDEMGSDDERLESRGGGRSSEQPDLRIGSASDELPPISEADSLIQILRHGDYLKHSKVEIVSFLLSEMDEAKKNEYIKGCYQQNFFGEMLKKETNEHLGYHAEPDGLVLYVGHYPERKEESKFSWELTARLIEALIKDKNYLDEPKEDKQLSLLDMEKNVVESAYEPPSKVEKTLAFSQAAIDEFIRLGGCTKGSTERIYGYYRRANDTAENVLFLRHEYETDHVGIIIDGRKMSASWDDDGVRIAEGDKVEGAWKSIILTWEEVDKRTRELIELGQYIPKHEAERADATYEDMYNSDLAGVVYYQTCACREKTSYLNQYSKFTQMTRAIAEPSEVKVTYNYFLWIDQTSTLRFQIDYVEMHEGLEDGQRICDYFATSPAIDAKTVVTQGWTIGYDKSFSIKDIEFGGSGSGTVSYSTTEGVASTYNSTKIEDYFNVRFNFKDLAYETSTQEQQNLAYNQCSFYTGVSYYGLPSVMEEYSHNSSYKVVFSGYYVRANPFGNTSVDLVPGSATATENLNYVYYTY